LDGLSWRVFVFACGLPNIGLLVGRLFWKWESPRFLLTKGRLYEATMVLKDMAKFNDKALPPGQLISLESTVAVANEVRPWYSSYVDIWQSGLLLPVATISILFFGQTFGYYGLTIWMRRLIAAKGIKNLSTPSMFLVIGVAELPNLLLTKFLIEKSGRKAVLMVNFLGSSLSSIILIFANSRVPFLVASGLTYFFIVGSWTALYVLAPEMFPTQVRASAFGIAQCVGKLAGFLSPLFFAWLWDTHARPVTIVMIIAGCFVVAALTAAMLLIETSGKRLSDSIETPQTFKK
jgi:putative MFS transporter